MGNILENIGSFAIKTSIIFTTSIFLFFICFQGYKDWVTESANSLPYFGETCNVAVIQVGGEMGFRNTVNVVDQTGVKYYTITNLGDADRIVEDLRMAYNDPKIKNIILQVDSYGGSPAAAEIITNFINKNKLKPTVAHIRDAAYSAGYFVTLPTDRIFAQELSGVGSIGATASFLNNYEKNKKEGIQYINVSSGKFKDGLNPETKVDEEILAYERDQVKKVADVFKDLVAKFRKIDREVVEKLSDGRGWTGKEAKELGLVDEIGGESEILTYLTERNMGEQAVLCQKAILNY